MFFKNQKFLVAGMSRSGEGAASFLLDRGAEVFMYDDVSSASVQTVMKSLEDRGAHTVSSNDYADAIENCDILVLSPGIPIDNALPVAFRRQGKAIIGEEELGALYLRATAVAVTGTNGKTTTVSMIEHTLKTAGLNAEACGNIGYPLISAVDKLGYDDYAVIEISSFQLETLTSLRPHIAVITNITEDHLNRHYNMENYIFLKSKLIRSLKESEFAVLNFDDERVRSLSAVTKAAVVYFSALRRLDYGSYIEDGWLCFNGEKFLTVDELSVGGTHNVYNALACLASCVVLGLPKDGIVTALKSFKGIKHRIEFVKTINGVNYINDSKATNIDATLKAADSMKAETVLLLGGKDKGYDYVPLFDKMKDSMIVHAIIFGENRFRIMNDAVKCDYYNFSLCTDFFTAFKLSVMIAKRGQNVLLSPASASFDGFSGYEERGETFIELVNGLDENPVGE